MIISVPNEHEAKMKSILSIFNHPAIRNDLPGVLARYGRPGITTGNRMPCDRNLLLHRHCAVIQKSNDQG